MDKQVLRHFLFWLIYTLTLSYLNASNQVTQFELFPETVSKHFLNQLSIQLILTSTKLPFAYVILYLVKRFLQTKLKRLNLLLFILFVLILGSISLSFVNHTIVLPYFLGIINSEYSIFSTGSLLYHLLSLAFVTGFGIGLELLLWRYKTQIQLIKMQNQLVETELKYLKGQLNPHFLFNTLNNIYALARKKSDLTADAVLKLSALMRFVLYETNKKTIKLAEELNQIQAYIDLEKIRYTNRLSISFTKKIDDENAEIAPLLLIHFVENAFKHGVSEMHKESFVNIHIELKNKILKADIVNSYNGLQETNTHKIGMENIRRQLTLIYPKHELKNMAVDNVYTVTLIISLHD